MKTLILLSSVLLLLIANSLTPLFVWSVQHRYAATLAVVEDDDVKAGSLHRVAVQLSNEHRINTVTQLNLQAGQTVQVEVLSNAWGWQKERLQLAPTTVVQQSSLPNLLH